MSSGSKPVRTGRRFIVSSTSTSSRSAISSISACRSTIWKRSERIWRKAALPVEETIAIKNRPRFFVRDPFENLIELTQITGDYD